MQHAKMRWVGSTAEPGVLLGEWETLRWHEAKERNSGYCTVGRSYRLSYALVSISCKKGIQSQ